MTIASTSEKTDRPRPVVGIWQYLPSPMVSRHLALMGWDWVILDMQHCSFTTETVYECIHVLRAGGVKPLVRVGIGNPFEVQRALDLGAGGVIVPMVNAPEEAKAMAAAAKYPPLGVRSVGGDAAFHDGDDYVDRANAETLLLVQVEHIDAVNRVEEIMDIPGMDGVFLGPTDLALSMGLSHRGYASDPAHRAAIQRTLDAGNARGKLVGCNTYSLEDAAAKLAQGFLCITQQSDLDLFMRSGTALLGHLRETVTANP
jgi:2-keto-3-deoxy-L-rhamnonate aldolase RhmA